MYLFILDQLKVKINKKESTHTFVVVQNFSCSNNHRVKSVCALLYLKDLKGEKYL